MTRPGQFGLLVLLGGSLPLAGCYVGAAGGTVMVEAFSVVDEYKPAVGPYAARDPMPDQLTSLVTVVVLPFYAHATDNKVELRQAVRISGGGGRIKYPARPYVSDWSAATVIDHAAMVFARGCWPAILYYDSNPPGGSVWEKNFPPHRIQPLGVDHLMHVVLYRDTRPYDDDVDRAANNNSLLVMFQLYLDDLIKAVETAPTLRPAERAMVYTQLRAVARNAAGRLEVGHGKSIYERAAVRLFKRLRALTEVRE